MKPTNIIFFIASIFIFNNGCMNENKSQEEIVGLQRVDSKQITYILPSPVLEGTVSVEEALSKRRTHRSFIKTKISAEDLSQILWSAYGITKPLTGYPHTRGGLRTTPSAGGLYPLEVYVLIGNVKGIEPGVYKYISRDNKLVCAIKEDMRENLSIVAHNQEMIRDAPACLVFCAVFSRSTQVYGDRGQRFVLMELGHSAQNVYLQVEALHLGTCSIGAFNDAGVKKVLALPDEEEPYYIMPIGEYYHRSEF